MGGLFLKQNEGVSIMLIPSLAITPVLMSNGLYNIKVSLVDVSITDTNDVSGTKSAQVFAKVDSVVKNQVVPNGNIKYLAPTGSNARFLVIRFTPDITLDPKIRQSTTKLWKRAFDQVKVVTQKTMSEKGLEGKIAINDIIQTYYIDDTANTSQYNLSADLVIGNYMGKGLPPPIMASDYSSESVFFNDINKNMQNSALDPNFWEFPFEYSKARVSLVMQSGAL